MKYFVLVMLLSAGPVLADTEEYEYGDPDDVECHVVIDEYTITYTYSYKDPPKVMPMEGLMCYPIGEYYES